MNSIMKKFKSIYIVYVCIGLLSASLVGCQKEEGVQILPERNYVLVWSDEFDGAAGELVDSSNWSYDIGRGVDGWGNQELQFYRDIADNVSLDGEGNLAITARNTPFGGAPFTSGRVKTKDLVSAQYGRIEARVKLPYGPGLWPAFWMLGSNIDNVGWPQCGEIDILEYRGQEPFVTYGSVHGPGYSGGESIGSPYYLSNDRFDKEFHVFAIEWGKNFIEYYVDGIRYQTVTPDDVDGEWVFNQPFYVLFNVAVGGTFVGFPTSGTPWPQTMLVDYIRVYEEQ